MKESTDNGCQSIIEQLLKHGYSHQVPTREIENAIIQADLGRDERTWKRWIRSLEALDYIKKEKGVYVLNVMKVPGLFKILKNLPQTYLSTPSLSPSHNQQSKEE